MLRPVPRPVARALSVLVVLAWLATMAVLWRQLLSQSPVALAADLAGYSASAQWRGVYYRGDKIGFSVGQTSATADGYEMREDGRLQMTLLGAPTAVRLRSWAEVDHAFRLKRFTFSLDPGSGPTQIEGRLDGTRLLLTIRTPSGERSETRQLAEAPALSLNLPRTLAARGLRPGLVLSVPVFDPATLSNASMRLEVKARELLIVAGRPMPAFRVEAELAGIRTLSWVTDVGDVVREESPMGLLVVRETAERAQTPAVAGAVQADLLQSAAVVPVQPLRIDDPTTVSKLRLRLTGIETLDPLERSGDGQTVSGDVLEIRDPRDLPAGPPLADRERFLRAEPFLEVDAPEIRAEAQKASAGATSARLRAERLVRHVHAILEKKPTLSLPSALQVLKTRVGDCNEHTALYVAMARALGLPARIAVGLVQLRGAFYYHAWPEVFVDDGDSGGRGLWLAVDPTFNQFPADATHVRLARGGLERQAAILGMIGRARLEVLDVELRPGSTPVLVGRPPSDLRPLDLALPQRSQDGCWSSPRRRG